ncbi:MAG: hypothetical protein IT232_09000, partial [Flavobacteriales bacterium]|nr:hypothetical protein [Flavobacteriales bacterium]
MKKIVIVAAMLLSANLFAQTNPQGTPPPNNTNAKANAAWYRGGNFAVGTTPPSANIFGTMWNSPIYTYTNGVNRMIVNGDRSATIGAALGGFNVPTNGYV